MKCAMCGKEIKGRDYIRMSTPDKKEIYVHSMPCEWYDFERDTDNKWAQSTFSCNTREESITKTGAMFLYYEKR